MICEYHKMTNYIKHASFHFLPLRTINKHGFYEGTSGKCSAIKAIPELFSLISCQGPDTPACFKSFEAFKMKLWRISARY